MSAGVSIYVMIDGVYTAADGIIGMVAAANDKDYTGMISTVASKVAENVEHQNKIRNWLEHMQVLQTL